MKQTGHSTRIKQELTRAGITKYGLIKLESRYLPKLIHEDERIGGIAYGRYKKGSAMLVATQKRVIFLDRIPFYTNFDELTYDVVSGVKRGIEGRFSTITLHTRLGDYKLRFVNNTAAEKFVKYIEKRSLESDNGGFTSKTTSKAQPTKKNSVVKRAKITSDAQAFLLKHDLATISTTDREGNVNGAVVYYVLEESNDLFVITKSETQKIHNILANPKVALTVFDAKTLETVQISGQASLEEDDGTRQTVFQQIVKPRIYDKDIKWPPVTKLANGSYIVIRITPTDLKFRDYK